MTALKPLGSAQREISLRHSLFEEAIALVRNSAVGVLVTAIQVIAGSACRNFSPPGPFLHSGLRPHFKKGLAVVHLGAETAMFDEGHFLNNQYTVFGKVTKGMEFVDAIKKGERSLNGQVNNPDKIIKMRTSDAQ